MINMKEPKTNRDFSVDSKQEKEDIGIKNLILKIIELWPWILLCVGLAYLITSLYLRYAEPLYNSTTSLLIRDDKKSGRSAEAMMLQELNLGGSKLVENEMEVLRSYDLSEAVVRKTDLFIEYRTRGRLAERVVFGKELPVIIQVSNPDTIKGAMWILTRKNRENWLIQFSENNSQVPIKFGTWYQHEGIRFRLIPNINWQVPAVERDQYIYRVKLLNLKQVARSLNNRIKVFQTKTTAVINIELEDQNGDRALAVLNSYITIYDEQGLKDKNEETANVVNFLNDRLNIVTEELQGVEGKVEEFKSRNRITDISAESSAYLDLAKDVDKQKATQETQMNIINALEENLRSNQSNPKLVPSTLGIDEPSLGQLISRHNELIMQKERQVHISSTRNPLAEDINNQIKDVRENLLSNIRNLRQAYQIALDDINAQDRKLNARLQSIPQIERNLVQIVRDQTVKEQLYLFLLQKREEAAVSLASSITDSRVIEMPRAIGQTYPNNGLVKLVGLIAGFLLPLLILFVKEFLNDKIQYRPEIEKGTKAALLGDVSYIKKLKAALMVRAKERSVISEQFRNIRTNLSFTGKGSNLQTILVTSHRPGEGKSFISINLAATYALLNKKVAVLEFDLRKPQVQYQLGLNHKIGISNFLSGSLNNIDDILIEVPDMNGNLFVVPSGPLPPNPAELILTDRMPMLIEELKKRFDTIIIDTPPFGLVTDGVLLKQFADVTIVVLRQNFTFKEVLTSINEMIYHAPDNPVYTVLNAIGEKRGYGYTGYGYGYGYGYGEYYGHSQKGKKGFKIKNPLRRKLIE